MRDPYSTLGLARGASDEDIKRAYRRLAKRLHPDLNPGRRGAEQQFREASQAYALLSDPVKRRRFDRGEIDAEGRERGFGGFGSGFAGARAAREQGFGDFSIDEVLQEFLHRGRRGGNRAQTGAANGTARPLNLTLSFIEAARGGKRAVTLPDGRSVEVAIPAGVEVGQKLRLKDRLAGDILIDIGVEPHPLFSRKDRDIHAEASVPLVDAVLGGSIVVPTIHGDVTVKVPKGANTGAVLRLKGRGIGQAGNAGDHYVRLKLVLPERDPELTQILERWAAKQR